MNNKQSYLAYPYSIDKTFMSTRIQSFTFAYERIYSRYICIRTHIQTLHLHTNAYTAVTFAYLRIYRRLHLHTNAYTAVTFAYECIYSRYICIPTHIQPFTFAYLYIACRNCQDLHKKQFLLTAGLQTCTGYVHPLRLAYPYTSTETGIPLYSR